MSEERAMQAGQYSYSYLSDRSVPENVAFYEPDALTELHERGRLYVIADSLGGGTVVCQYATQRIVHDYYRQSTETDVEKRLIGVIQKTNLAIYERNQAFKDRRPMSVAVMVGLIHQNKLIIVNIGDNRAYVTWQQSIERLGPEKPKANPPTPRCLGLAEEVPIEIYYRRLFPGDSAVLCSGGLTGYLSEQEIAQTVSQHPPVEAVRHLTRIARDHACRENVAVSVTQVLEQAVNQAPPTRAKLPESPDWDTLLSSPAPSNLPTASRPIVPPSPIKVEEKTARPWAALIGAIAVVLLLCVGGGSAVAWRTWFTAAEPEATETIADALTPPTPTELPIVATLTTPDNNVLTQLVSPVATPTQIITDTNTSATTPTPSVTPSPTATPAPTVDMPPGCTSGARFYEDVTIPDGAKIPAGSTFDKVWRIENNGTCPWAPGYTIRYVDGDVLHSQTQFNVPLLMPGVITEVTVSLLAPQATGSYRTHWQVYDLKGEAFGADLYAQIEVVPPEPGAVVNNPNQTTLYDFVANADKATWTAQETTYTVTQKRIDTELTIPVPQGIVAKGIAEMRGRRDTAQEVLLTHPHQTHGLIQGVYGVDIPLQPTDSLIASLGLPQAALLNDDGIKFEVAFTPKGGSEQVILSKLVTYRESPVNETLPLKMITADQTGTFTLRVNSGANSTYDWALWLDLRLVRE